MVVAVVVKGMAEVVVSAAFLGLVAIGSMIAIAVAVEVVFKTRLSMRTHSNPRSRSEREVTVISVATEEYCNISNNSHASSVAIAVV